MVTAGRIVKDALLELTVQAQEQTVPAIDLNTGIRYLNDLMTEYDATGIKLGYTLVNSSNDEVTIPRGAVRGVIYNLALSLAHGYGVPVGQALATNAATGLTALGIIGVRTGKSAFPSNLPIGSGNEDASGIYSSEHFFPDCCEDANPCSGITNNGDGNGL